MITPSEQSYPENSVETEFPTTKICLRKECSFQQSPQPLANFYPSKSGKFGVSAWCRACYKINSSTPASVQRVVRPAPDGFKICCRENCSYQGVPQLLADFSRNKRTFDGYSYECKACSRASSHAAWQRGKEKFLSRSDVYREGETKICSHSDCQHRGVTQSTANFLQSNSASDGLSSHCKDCQKKATDNWRYNNSEQYLGSIKRYQKENRERLKETKRIYDRDVDKPYRSEHWAEYKIIQIKSRCLKREIPVDIESCDLLPLPKTCLLFGIKLDYSGGKDKRFWASVDRIKPELGYTKGNVRIISLAANMAKSDGDDTIFDAIKLAYPQLLIADESSPL